MTLNLSQIAPAIDTIVDLTLLGLDIVFVFILFYLILTAIRGTRGTQLLIVVVMLFGASILSGEQYLNLPTLHWLLERFTASLLLILVVLFQSDIRYGLIRLTRDYLGNPFSRRMEATFVEELVKACTDLSRVNIGALIAVERRTDLIQWTEEAIRLDAEVSKELLFAVFNPANANPLHDGAVVIRDNRISAAACFLPLTSSPSVDSKLGTRHRAAIGLSEDTDAIVIVVSEETGIISVAVEGKLTRNLDANSLRALLQRLLQERGTTKDDTGRATNKGGAHV